MKRRPYRVHHALEILDEVDNKGVALDRAVNRYLRLHKAIGGNDRRWIGEVIYGVMRWKELLEYQGAGCWEDAVMMWEEIDPWNLDRRMPPHVQCSMREDLFELIAAAHGEERAIEIGLECNRQAPLMVRVNTAKISRNDLLAKWHDLPCKACALSDVGIVFSERTKILDRPEYKAGLFEIQDEGSQLIANMVDVKPGESVIDYCAGAGGKSLAIAPKMNGRGQLYLHDIRRGILYEARRRFKRAGSQNVQYLLDLKKIRAKWVLADVPCSGSGTWRRNPDLKWRFTLADIKQIMEKQVQIVKQTLKHLEVGGTLVYATCSIFPQENEQQIERLCHEYDLKVEGEPFASLPALGEMDGFFGAKLVK